MVHTDLRSWLNGMQRTTLWNHKYAESKTVQNLRYFIILHHSLTYTVLSNHYSLFIAKCNQNKTAIQVTMLVPYVFEKNPVHFTAFKYCHSPINGHLGKLSINLYSQLTFLHPNKAFLANHNKYLYR